MVDTPTRAVNNIEQEPTVTGNPTVHFAGGTSVSADDSRLGRLEGLDGYGMTQRALAHQLGGWAVTHWPMQQHLTHVGATEDEDDRNCAALDWWTPPHRMALTPDIVDDLLQAAEHITPRPGPYGTQYALAEYCPRDLLAELKLRVNTANYVWWKLDVDSVFFHLKHYTEGQGHGEHMEWVPAFANRWKFAAGAQLSASADYVGGDFFFHYLGHRIQVPRTRGTFVAFPAWIHHYVTPLRWGERWSLIANVHGPHLR